MININGGEDLKNEFVQFEKLLIKKYGEPHSQIKDFAEEDDSMPEMYIKFNEFDYNSIWKTDKGRIILSINNDMYVILGYVDMENYKLQEQEMLGDL